MDAQDTLLVKSKDPVYEELTFIFQFPGRKLTIQISSEVDI